MATLQRIAGPALILGGLGVIGMSFWLAVAVVYLGIAVLILEVCRAPELLHRSQWIQITALGACFAGLAVFTIVVVLAPAPVQIQAYAMRTTGYVGGTDIAGIQWSDKFTELRVSITNTGEHDYDGFDFLIQPDEWTHKAAILPPALGCNLLPAPGDDLFFGRMMRDGPGASVTATRVGEGIDVHDSLGTAYEILASNGGYRLRCSSLPRRATVRVVFAMVTVPAHLHFTDPLPNGGLGVRLSHYRNVKSPVDLLGPRPFPRTVVAGGSYRSNAKPFSVAPHAVEVGDGN